MNKKANMKPPAEQIIDIMEDVGPSGDLSVIKAKAKELVTLEAEIADLEYQLKKTKNTLLQLQTVTLPELMAAHQVTKLGLEGGFLLDLEDFVSASIPAPSTIDKTRDPDERLRLSEQRSKAFDWLRTHPKGDPDLIKNVVTVEIPRGADAVADELMAGIAKLKLAATRQDTIHAQTLTAWVKERLNNGAQLVVDLPVDLLNIHVGKRAVCAIPKDNKRRKSTSESTK
jgi:hypothetical protein